MIYWTYNGERLSRKTWVDSDGTKHPPNWDIWPDEEKIARGLVRVEEPDPVPPEPTYEDLRRGAYGPVGDQLDMQWHDLVDGTTTWKDHVAAVKAAHPKPE
tara:strand:- start:3585 stop:3887 length:303 start_codon:yes stop_codon:yes gene_type:complete